MSFLEGLLWLTLNVYHEARSEPEIGQMAVAHVTLNRAIEKKKSVGEIVTAPTSSVGLFKNSPMFLPNLKRFSKVPALHSRH